MKIIVTGLPYFGRKISALLKNADAGNNYIFLNTYYSNYDRLRFLWHILTAKTVYSINGATGKSFVLSLAIKFKKRVVFHWVGSDLELARVAINNNTAEKRFIDFPVHLTDSPWYVTDLKEIGINAKYLPLLSVDKAPDSVSFPTEFNVLAYIPQDNQEFYGILSIIELAKVFPEINFNITGSSEYSVELPTNIKLLGWIKDMKPVFENTVVSIRFPKHDGLSFFVLESLLYSRYVIYNYPIDNSILAKNIEEIKSGLTELLEKFKAGKLELNIKGREFVIREFSQGNINKLAKILTK
ncbi:MAG: hypothetical protein HY951_13700 [Bacteroidia bacterium]|nr:hypothetical protein [Bacteroidia bacterium]